jgi:hypothetical protein
MSKGKKSRAKKENAKKKHSQGYNKYQEFSKIQ